jgi:enoyl-CoA hydratase
VSSIHPTVQVEKDGEITVVTVDSPTARNAVDRPTADALEAAFREFDADGSAAVAVLTGANGTFCAGADLKAIGEMAEGRTDRVSRFERSDHAPMGPTRLLLSKPVIAAVEGYAVAGGLELAVWCDLRVVAEDAIFGVFCRRWGVPLIDGGTVRLPRLIGLSRALDLILTGRPVAADEAYAIGLANRIVPSGTALQAAIDLARQLAAFPQVCMRADRHSAFEAFDRPLFDALLAEHDRGGPALEQGMAEGVARFVSGAGRHGAFSG